MENAHNILEVYSESELLTLEFIHKKFRMKVALTASIAINLILLIYLIFQVW